MRWMSCWAIIVRSKSGYTDGCTDGDVHLAMDTCYDCVTCYPTFPFVPGLVQGLTCVRRRIRRTQLARCSHPAAVKSYSPLLVIHTTSLPSMSPLAPPPPAPPPSPSVPSISESHPRSQSPRAAPTHSVPAVGCRSHVAAGGIRSGGGSCLRL